MPRIRARINRRSFSAPCCATGAASRLADAQQAEHDLTTLDDEIEELKLRMKGLRDDREMAVARLRGIVRDGDRPLLDGDEEDDA